jgi:putative heme-binding domain-containing protein
MMRCLPLLFAFFLALVAGSAAAQSTASPSLAAVPREDLAREARERGDARRGAVLFHQQHLMCARCHEGGPAGQGSAASTLGPDLAKLEQPINPAAIVESILEPSKTIREGYQGVTIVTDAGQTFTGLVAEDRANEVVLRDAARNGELVTLPKDEIEHRQAAALSLMPAGLVDQLSDRQQFLDLTAYVLAIAAGGPSRRDELAPPAGLLEVKLPEYEHDLDHAGLIGGLDDESLKRGEAIYARVCRNCHGTLDEPGSLPTSLRFASGRFKSGADPFGLYRTLTHGFGQMAAQTWMVPRQKYDVIHYLREAILKPHNASQYVPVDAEYLASLPRGASLGPEPVDQQPWLTMDYGPHLCGTYEVGSGGRNIAHKGIAVRLDAGPGGVARGQYWLLYDHDTLRLAGAWSGRGFIDWQGISFDGQHGVHPHVVGDVHVDGAPGPGWADPRSASVGFDDPRLVGRDGKRYGPLPREWGRLQGIYHHGDRALLAYRVGETSVLELPGLEFDASGRPVFTRTIEVGPASEELTVRLAPAAASLALVGGKGGPHSGPYEDGGNWLLKVAPHEAPVRFKVLLGDLPQDALDAVAQQSPKPEPLEPFTQGGPPRWPNKLTTQIQRGEDAGPLAVDVLTPPDDNPWLAQMRLTGLDFFPDADRAAVCSWDGDVWLVSGLTDTTGRLTWQRIASGMFQPLGIKIVGGQIFVTCRDQLVRLEDRNGDGETDFYACFNSDHQVTEHFHEFAMGLQTDAAGNFYYAKSARHALKALVPHHGTLLRVSPDGSRTDIVARGFRAANGVCLNPDGTFFVTDQEGHWNPKNRINWVREGGFYGNMWGYHDVTDTTNSAMEQPLCWITNGFDRSPAELLWVPADAWGPLAGSLLNLSYGYGQAFIVPHEQIETAAGGKQMQGGMVALPIPRFPTGIMRGRFHPQDKQLYVCGMYCWAGNQTQPGGIYRIRSTGKPVHLPVTMRATTDGVELVFSEPLDRSAEDVKRYQANVWDLERSEDYGSPHLNERSSPVTAAKLSDDGRTLRLTLPELQPTWCFELHYHLVGAGGEPVGGLLHGTIHHLPK